MNFLEENQQENLENQGGNMPSFLSAGLDNNIKEIEFQLEAEKDSKKRQELQEKRDKCIEIAKERGKEINSETGLREACLQIESDEHLIERIGKGSLDEVDIDMIMRSDLAPFIDNHFAGQLEIAMNQMTTVDRVKSIFSGTGRYELELGADREWTKFTEETKGEIKKLETEKQELQTNPGKDRYERNKNKARLKKIEREIKDYKRQLETGAREWKHKFRTKTEKAKSGRVMNENLHNDTILKLQDLFKSAKAYKLEQIHAYLESRTHKLDELISGIEAKGQSQSEFIETAKEQLEKAKGLYLNPNIKNPAELERIAKSFDDFEEAVRNESGEIAEKEERITDPEQKASIIESIRNNHGKLQGTLKDLKELAIEELEERVVNDLTRKHGFKKESAVVKKQLEALRKLKNQEGEIVEQIQNLEAEIADLDNMPAEELIRLEESLSVLGEKLNLIQEPESSIEEIETPSNQQGLLAHETLQKLEHCHNNEDLLEVLKETLDPDHLEIVDKSSFDSQYRDYTEKGHMVMQEKGESWKIVVDQSAFSEIDFNELKKEFRHELLHVEFEKNTELQKELAKEFLETNKEQWPEIRQAFLDMAKEKNKQPPHGDQWKDEDIFSELYAMQDSFGQVFRPEIKNSADHLNNLLAGMGLGAAIGNIAEKSKKFEKDDITKIRGYESGEGEEGSSSSTAKKSVDQGEASHKKYKNDINGLESRIKELQQSSYLGNTNGAKKLLAIMSEYLKDTHELNNELLKDAGSELIISTIEARNAKVADELNEIETEIGKVAKHAPNDEISIFRKMWLNTKFMSLVDIGQVVTDAVEFLERRHGRKKADHAATLGIALFGGTDLGREAYARQQKAEADEVQEWKGRYENLDAWQLLKEMKNLAHAIDPSADQLKAIVRILAEKGRLDWWDPNLWICLNRLQGSVKLKPGDKVLLHNPVLLRQKLHTAMGEIWDYDEYSGLLRQNESAYESEKSKYDSEHDRSADTLTQKLDSLLERKRNGENVDPMEYESIIEYCIKQGKSYAENIMFHMLIGTAEGILRPDRCVALGKHLNAWPALEWFAILGRSFSQADYENLCKTEFGASYKSGTLNDKNKGRDFMNWYWRVVQNARPVVDRVKKSVNERGWDHDWGRSIASLGTALTTRQFLSGRSGQIETKATAIGNMYVGFIQWLEENSKNPDFATKENFASIAARIAMAEGILNGTAYNRKENDINARQDEAMNNTPPREGGVGRHGGKSTRFHRDITCGYLNMIDDEFFSFLLARENREARENNKKEALGKWCANYLSQHYPELAEEMKGVTVIDQIYDRMDMIINAMFNSMSNSKFKQILKNLAPSD